MIKFIGCCLFCLGWYIAFPNITLWKFILTAILVTEGIGLVVASNLKDMLIALDKKDKENG